MNIDYQLMGARIAALRRERRWTQAQLAERSDLSNNYLSNIENNHSIPSLETLMKICLALEVTPDQLLMGTMPQEKDYLDTELSMLFSQCTPAEKRCILRLAKVIIEERGNPVA